MGGTSVPTLSAPIAATRHKSIGTEVPPTTAPWRPTSPGCPAAPSARQCARRAPRRNPPSGVPACS
ncbi:DUF6053 domain-containing protein [Lysobacter enzymogenes]|uniref:DUF6053 domain-containing protein n=1 Tax=Lysobacter enzymogenes TaxID=69 RepID=UPI003CCE01C7